MTRGKKLDALYPRPDIIFWCCRLHSVGVGLALLGLYILLDGNGSCFTGVGWVKRMQVEEDRQGFSMSVRERLVSILNDKGGSQ